MEIIFTGIVLFFLAFSIFANIYFINLLREIYSTIVNLSLEISFLKDEMSDLRKDVISQGSKVFSIDEGFEEFFKENKMLQSDIFQKISDINYINETLKSRIDDLHSELQVKNESQGRPNNWDSVRDAFARVNPKIQVKEQV